MGIQGVSALPDIHDVSYEGPYQNNHWKVIRYSIHETKSSMLLPVLSLESKPLTQI